MDNLWTKVAETAWIKGSEDGNQSFPLFYALFIPFFSFSRLHFLRFFISPISSSFSSPRILFLPSFPLPLVVYLTMSNWRTMSFCHSVVDKWIKNYFFPLWLKGYKCFEKFYTGSIDKVFLYCIMCIENKNRGGMKNEDS